MPETHETPVRTVADADHRVWHVYVVPPGLKWDIEIEDRRRHFLRFEHGEERRWMHPVPEEWMQWTDSTLLHWLGVAKLDLRAP